MNIAIVGYGEQGRTAYDYWLAQGNSVTICDQNDTLDVPQGALTKLGPDYLSGLTQFDCVVRSPSVHPRDIIEANGIDIIHKITTVTNEFLRVCPTKNIIGVTGTKGKGTTSSLITAILRKAGLQVHLGGNIGIPPLDLLQGVGHPDSAIESIQPDDWVVLELANFQIIDLSYPVHIAVCLMIEPEHLNWHANFEEYVGAKQRIFSTQTEQDIAIYYADNVTTSRIAHTSKGTKIPYYQEPGAVVSGSDITIDGQYVCDVSELKLLGMHNWQNVCAAVTAAWQVTKDIDAIRQAVIGFEGLPHRLEKVRELEGVTYFNDSFASAPPATVAAIHSIIGPKILIMGGFDRGLDLTDVANNISENADYIRKVLLIGQSAERVATALRGTGYQNVEILGTASMTEIVKRARQLAQSGDSVILSPGFASFDMFKNFEDRGLQYKDCINQLS